MWTRHHGLEGKDLENLEILVIFCLQMYFKMYFNIEVILKSGNTYFTFKIQVKHHLIHGPHHILTQLRISRTLSKQVAQHTVVTVPYLQELFYSVPILRSRI